MDDIGLDVGDDNGGVERILGILLARTRALQDDMTSIKTTVEGMKSREGVRRGVFLSAGAISGLAGGTIGAKLLAALGVALGAAPK